MKPFWYVSLMGLALVSGGCGGEVATPDSKTGAFNIIDGAVEDICSRVLDPKYKGTRDLGTDTDRMGLALNSFTKAAEGTPIAEDAKKIKDKMIELETLVSKRAPVDKQREAAKTLKEMVAAAKAKL